MNFNIQTFLSKFLRRRPIERWVLLATIEVPTITTFQDGSVANSSGLLYYHLFESNLSNRKVEFATTETKAANLERDATHLKEYHTTIYPWLCGRYSPSVPLYSEVDSDDLISRLATP